MFTFFSYEWRAWWRSPLTWILFAIISALVMGAVSSENVTIGGGVGSVNKNAPSVIQDLYSAMSILGLLIITAFMNGTAMRDFERQMEGLIFTKPIRKNAYFFGKFLGAFAISLIPFLGVSFGALIGPYMPWATSERYSDFILSGHLSGFFVFALPNLLFGGALIYSLAMTFRSALVSWIGAMVILVLLAIADGLSSDLENQWWSAILDPFGGTAKSIAGKYLTVDEKNLAPVPVSGLLLTNRLVWMAFSLLLLLVMSMRFQFSTRAKGKRSKKASGATESAAPSNTVDVLRTWKPTRPGAFQWSAFFHILRFEFRSIIRNPTFLIILAIGVINLVVSLVSFSEGYGVEKYPVTYSIIDTIQGSFYLFLIAIVVFYSGVLVFKERDVRIDEIKDATPFATGMYFSAKMMALIGAIAVMLMATSLVGMLSQLLHGFTDLRPEQYFWSLWVDDLLSFAYLAVLAVFFHYLLNNRFLAYFVFILFLILNAFIWNVLEINSNMLQFGGTPFVLYSDMNHYGPFVENNFWFNLYWTLFCVLLAHLAYGFYLRGRESGRAYRWLQFRQRLGTKGVQLASILLLFLGTAGFTYYNTRVLNSYDVRKVREQKQKDYELTYKKYEKLPLPTIYHLDFDLDLRPYERDLHAHIVAQAYNRNAEPLRELHFTLPSFSDSLLIEVEGAALEMRDNRLDYRIYRFEQPILPGDSFAITVNNYLITRGFENEVGVTSVTQNGSFFNNGDLFPVLGYESGVEIGDKNRRKKMDLPEKKRMPRLNPADTLARMINYVGADWVSMRTTFRTAPDQIAIAPGSLIREYEEGGQKVYEYQLDHKALNFFSFMSARYTVTRDQWNDVQLEVYHIPEHHYNVENMLRSMKKSLAYYEANFGEYKHQQARIIEFPRYSSFAQAFAGTMPYSESIGFIYDLREVEEEDIDMAFYVVAHEMAHQWWAHQLIGAQMRGSEMMSESFAQYSALMVMEKEYGRDLMRKFLRYEMDRYLRGRSGEREAERPLMEVEQQGYIHYPKGSLVMYYLKEMIGEGQVNAALAELISDHGYQEPPFPTSVDAVEAFRRHTPDSLQYLITDLFADITLFSNRVEKATAVPEGEKFRVSIEVITEKYKADSLGTESAVEVRDYIDIGLFAKEGDNKLARPILMKRLKVSGRENSFTFLVDEKPDYAGVDPYNYLVDRIPDDNVERVE